MSEVVVVAVFRVKPGSEERVEDALRTLIALSHEHEGCIRYALQRDTLEPGRFAMVERWRSRADLDAHLAVPHPPEVAEAFGLLAEPPVVMFCDPVPAGDPERGVL